MIQYLKRHEIMSSISSIFMIIIAILLIANPIKLLTTVIMLFGMAIIIEGLARIINYIFLPKEERSYSSDIFEGIFSILAGILIASWNTKLLTIFPILISIWILIKSVLKIQIAIRLKDMEEEKKWIMVLVAGILELILGAVILFNPTRTLAALVRFAGIMLLVTEIVSFGQSIVWLYRFRKIEG